MRTRLLALVSASALPLAAAVIGATPASAAGSACGHYPPGNAYGLRGSTAPPALGGVRLSARVIYPGGTAGRELHCGGKTVVFFVSGPGEYRRLANGTINRATAKFHKSATDTSDADGLAQVSKDAPRTRAQSYLWYAAYTSDNHTGTARTAVQQVGR